MKHILPEGLRRKLAQLRATQEAEAQVPTFHLRTTPLPAPQWHPLMGNRIELAATGFYIVAAPQPGDVPFTLYTPEHLAAANGHHLQMLKAYGEQMAADRAQFTSPRFDVLAHIKRPTR